MTSFEERVLRSIFSTPLEKRRRECYCLIRGIDPVDILKKLRIKHKKITSESFSTLVKIKCSFHNEKTPSLKFTRNAFWHCLGCGDGGDNFSFVQRFLHKDQNGTFVWFHKNFGIPLPWKK